MSYYHGLAIYLSGGAGNILPNASLGGAISQADGGFFSPQSWVRNTPIPGITLCSSWSNALGEGILEYSASDGLLSWAGFGATQVSTPVSGDGLYRVGSPGRLMIKVVSSLLPLVDTSEPILIDKRGHNLFDPVVAAERTAGDTEYRCLWIKNHGTRVVENMVLNLETNGVESTILLGSEYLGGGGTGAVTAPDVERLQLVGTTDLAIEIDAASTVASILSKLQYGGRYFRGAGYGGEAQNSNGSTSDLPFEIVDEQDSTDLLSSVSWSPTLVWEAVEPGKCMSFWVQRTILPGADAINEQIRMSLEFTGD